MNLVPTLKNSLILLTFMNMKASDFIFSETAFAAESVSEETMQDARIPEISSEDLLKHDAYLSELLILSDVIKHKKSLEMMVRECEKSEASSLDTKTVSSIATQLITLCMQYEKWDESPVIQMSFTEGQHQLSDVLFNLKRLRFISNQIQQYSKKRLAHKLGIKKSQIKNKDQPGPFTPIPDIFKTGLDILNDLESAFLTEISSEQFSNLGKTLEENLILASVGAAYKSEDSKYQIMDLSQKHYIWYLEIQKLIP